MDAAISRLEALADTDPVTAPLAMLAAEALRFAAGDGWQSMVPDFDPASPSEGRPALAGVTIPVDPRPVRELLGSLSVLAISRIAGNASSIGSLPDPLALLEATINQDGDQLEKLSAESGTDSGLLATVGQLVALPLLRACGEKAEPLLDGILWEHGHCPVCAAWPTLAEVRGNERERWLHCGRCGTSWRSSHMTCVFCGNTSHDTQGYLAPEGSLESKKATTCERCHGYLKSVSTLLPMEPSDVLLNDLSTLELDGAALERGYSRPGVPGYELRARVVAQI